MKVMTITACTLLVCAMLASGLTSFFFGLAGVAVAFLQDVIADRMRFSR